MSSDDKLFIFKSKKFLRASRILVGNFLTFENCDVFRQNDQKVQQGNRGDMRKIHVPRQLFETSGSWHRFFEKSKKTRFYIWSRGVYVPKFGSVSFFVVVKRRRTDRLSHRLTYIQVN